ncbi:hypothetical protein Tco_0566537 [Tanacetum coccineum]
MLAVSISRIASGDLEFLASGPGCLSSPCCSRPVDINSALHVIISRLCLYNDLESLYHLCLTPTYSAAGAVYGVPGDESRVHTHDHDGSEAPNESPDQILLE